MSSQKITPEQLRSRWWFDNPEHPGTTALCIERYMNYGITLEELTSGKPIIGIAQSGSDLTPCNRHHIELVKRVKDGIRAAGDDPTEYLEIAYRVPERRFGAWPAAMREGFADARSETTGKPVFRLEARDR